MTTIKSAVMSVISSDPTYSMIVSSGLCNYTSMAKRIQRTVEVMLGRQVNLNSITKALTQIRIEPRYVNIFGIVSQATLWAEYGLNELQCGLNDRLPEGSLLVVRRDGYYTCLCKTGEPGKIALIRIRTPKEASNTPGLSLFITEYLYLNGVEFSNIYRLGNEIWITSDSENAGRILSILSDMIYRSQH
ncbi:hypothetical protein GCM10007108_05020 [Thermogymnomonas acidicola]|uniref:Uncharacterized protein n=1 Tax=Thermogymnomonas acidicola TaxID=399579 RepID=A0AA37BR05_9ARCH|nr:hypothetical protein [Thermogymnomonas acidicola]GGM69933.1 hypothetical protein GCM10007108_05020 [Thermogymnomonas acidicola]